MLGVRQGGHLEHALSYTEVENQWAWALLLCGEVAAQGMGQSHHEMYACLQRLNPSVPCT